ncbi:hypothetical protein EAH89_15835 [Roseomonas nepalensis]|uniref:Recombinase domain-containing protein n=1 Tax=Muricoccus nepalensis TaxID=1854500 RepID=A0A502FWL5_9PROT|nr:hypothetical protein EAH89_15835 [Roseomonas nepalensis]
MGAEVQRLRALVAEPEAEIARLGRKVRRLEARLPATAQANAARRAAAAAAAAEFAQKVVRHVQRLRLTRASTMEIAAALNEAGIATREGGEWSHRQVQRLLGRLDGSWAPPRRFRTEK